MFTFWTSLVKAYRGGAVYQLFGAATLLRVYATVVGLVALVAFLVRSDSMPTDILSLLRWLWAPMATGIAATTLLTLLGQTSLFPAVCRLGLLRKVLPDLDGTWEGTLESNWPQIAARLPHAVPVAGKLMPVLATVRIKARLLSVSMTLDAHSKYSSSDTVLVGLERHGAGEGTCLTYVYANRTAKPEGTDSSDHLGAARLHLNDDGGVLTLRGPYWTNRNWQKGLNTAGLATFRKSHLT